MKEYNCIDAIYILARFERIEEGDDVQEDARQSQATRCINTFRWYASKMGSISLIPNFGQKVLTNWREVVLEHCKRRG